MLLLVRLHHISRLQCRAVLAVPAVARLVHASCPSGSTVRTSAADRSSLEISQDSQPTQETALTAEQKKELDKQKR